MIREEGTYWYQLESGERQLVLLAMACLSIGRPGFHDYLREVAGKFDINEGDGKHMFDKFKHFNEPVTKEVTTVIPDKILDTLRDIYAKDTNSR